MQGEESPAWPFSGEFTKERPEVLPVCMDKAAREVELTTRLKQYPSVKCIVDAITEDGYLA
jgi:hypothetical protein